MCTPLGKISSYSITSSKTCKAIQGCDAVNLKPLTINFTNPFAKSANALTTSF